jgi:hypothetical protein
LKARLFLLSFLCCACLAVPLSAQDSLNVTKLGEIALDGVNDVHVRGNYAYAIEALRGLLVIDITDPASPVGVGSCSLSSPATALTISGDYAYVANGYYGGLVIVNIANPSHPLIEGSLTNWTDFQAVAVSGNYAYLAGDG